MPSVWTKRLSLVPSLLPMLVVACAEVPRFGEQDYLVYSIVLEELAGRWRRASEPSQAYFVVYQQADLRGIAGWGPVWNEFQQPDTDFLKSAFPKASATLIQRFVSTNREPVNLDNRFDGSFAVRMISPRRAREAFADEKGWSVFHAVYPSANALVKFSRIAFDRGRSQALLYVGYHCGSLCGTGYYFRLELVENVWEIVDEEVSWVS